ncbi:MAG: GTP 3',8-cyclase MoaA [bacterium]|jgi:cyclic pyranopterin phosphate synthase|nr:GTP 3',8-cyclase MoaA [bacterium]
MLLDPAGRRIRKLRVSLTDACQFRCFYCLPATPRFLPHQRLLPAAELIELVGRLAELGIDELRLTGGEPTLRPELLEIVRGLARLPIAKLGMTTNAQRLEPLLPALRGAGLHGVNISLDSLRPETFARITGGRQPAQVLAAARAARDQGLQVKLNVVLFRGLNDGEVPDFLRLAEAEGVTVRFLELMRIGVASQRQPALFIPADEVIATLRAAGERLTPLPGPPDATSFDYATAGGGRIGFIASESRPFCAGCSRLRLSATGFLRACLMSGDGLDLRGLPPAELLAALARVLAMRPLDRIAQVDEVMARIGG